MTGILLRVKRGDRFENIDIDQMTDTELDEFVANKRKNPADDGWNWVKVLAQWIRDNVNEQPPPA